MKDLKNIICTIAIGLMMIAQFVTPITAYADGETTPQPTDTPEVTATPFPPESTIVPVETSTSILPTDTPVPPDALEVTSTSIPTELTIDPVETGTPTLEQTIADPSLNEILQELPEGTGVVVLDENGNPEPLVTQEAVEIIGQADPMWCPEGEIPGDPGCTTSYPDLASLLSYLTALNGGTGVGNNGTIWIESTYNSSINDPLSSGFTLDGNVLTTWKDYSLTLQGGWDGNEGGTITTFNSVFSVPISILNWNNSVTINNITIQDTDGLAYSGLDVNTNGNVTINDSIFDGNYVGAYIETDGNVNIQNSVFSKNKWDGLQVFSDSGTQNTINLTGNQFVYNRRAGTDGYGAWLVTDNDDSINVTNNKFINNWYGLVAYTMNVEFGPDNEFNLNCMDIVLSGLDSNGYYTNYMVPGNYCGEPLPPPTPAAPLIVQVAPSGGKFTLLCIGQDGYAVNLPNGDLVNLFCPVSGEAEISRMDNTTLPAELPDGYTYASAFIVNILKDSKAIKVIEEGGYIQASFVALPLQSGNRYSVLYWDEENLTWVPIKDFLVGRDGYPQIFDLFPGGDDSRKIVSGVHLVTRGGSSRVEVATNFPGVFVLVQH